MNPVEAEVLRDITPQATETAAMQAKAERLTAACDKELAKLHLAGRAEVEGSVAKGTWLRGATDIDLFLLLDPGVPKQELEGAALAVGSAVLSAVQKKYAQHPYVKGTFDGTAVDLVPAYAVQSAHAKMSAVDRTPFHTAWVRGSLDEAMRGQVRLAKRWMKGVGVYGAETAIGGFSGYLVEILVTRFGSFPALVGWLAGAANPRRIALGEDLVTDEVAPLVVVDPVDPARNCSAAVTSETLERATRAALAYSAAPTRAFFFPKPPRAEPAAELHAALGAQKQAWVAVRLRPRTDRLDIVMPQFQRAGRTLQAGLEEAGFAVHRTDFASSPDGAEVLLQFTAADVTLAPTRLHRGPPDDSRPNAKRFREKWRDHPDAVGPVTRGLDGRTEVTLHVRHRTVGDWLAARLARPDALGRHVTDALPDHELLRDPALAPPAWQPRVADVVLGREPWQR